MMADNTSEQSLTISKALYDFLMGQGALDGVWFGDDPFPGLKPRRKYWWRSMLEREARPATTDEVERLTRDERLDYERQILAAEVEWVGLARKALAFCELIEGNTKDLDCALILANNVAEARKYDRFHVEPWMPRLLALKDAILSNPLFPNHGERQS